MRTRIAAAVAGLALLGATAARGSTPTLNLDEVLREVAASHRALELDAASAHNLYGEAWGLYAEVFCAQALARHDEERRAVLERIIKSALSAYQAGRSAYFELLAAEAARTRALADLADVLGQRRVGRARLDTLMGRDPGASDGLLIPPPISDVPQDSSAWADVITPAPVPRHRLGEAATAGPHRAEAQSANVELRGKVLVTHAAALCAQRRVRLLADTVVVAQQQAFDSAWNAYNGGEARLPVVLEAAEAWFEQQRALILARRDVAAAQARFVALTGRADLFGVTLPELLGTRDVR